LADNEGIGSAHTRDGGVVKVLVVDDDPAMRRLVVRLTSRHPGVTIREAEHGVEALALVEAERPDLIFTDVTMPYLDGLGLLEALRGSTAGRDIPVVAVSAISDRALVLRMVDLGIEDYLLKPLDPALAGERFDAIVSRIAAREVPDGRLAPPRATALLVDREPGYGDIVRAAVGDRFEVVDHLPASAALAWAITNHPALLLLGQGLPMPSEQVLARTARAAWECQVVLLSDHPGVDAPDDYHAVVARSHVPRKLAQALEGVIAALHSDGNVLTDQLRHAIREELAHACRQSLGILTGQESTEAAAMPMPEGVSQHQVPLTRQGSTEVLLLGVAATADDLAALQAAVEGEGHAPLLGAMATTATARVVNALKRKGWAFMAGAAEVVTEPHPDEPLAAVVLETEGGQRLHLALTLIAATPSTHETAASA
jgi:CheY-like chemotaxis protein